MAIELTVSDIRDALAEASRNDHRHGVGSTRLIGQLFHRSFATIFDDDGPHLADLLADVEPGPRRWQRAIERQMFRRVVGPALDRNQTIFDQQPDDATRLWQACCELAGWLAEIALTVHRTAGSLEPTRGMVECERPLRLTLERPGWRDAVVISGLADAVLRIPGRPEWCVVELKTTAAAPEVDLLQAAAYHMMLAAEFDGEPQGGNGTLGLISFTPARRERLLTPDHVAPATEQLAEFIGQLAGALGEPAAATATPPSDDPPWKRLEPEHETMQQRLLEVFANHRLDAEAGGQPIAGPTFIRFLINPKPGTRIRQFTQLADEVALGMGLEGPLMIDRAGGHIAVDVERPDRHIVRYRDVEPLLPAADPLHGSSKVLVGIDMEARPVLADLADSVSCHMLVAGTSGSGKSIWLRAALASLIDRNTPETLRVVLIDPKRNAFTAWKTSPFLADDIVFPDERPVTEVLDGLIDEMEDRYRQMEGVDDLAALISREDRCIPRIVCICDEYADLVTTREQRREIEARVKRLGAKARAAGIHLILATQSPRREVIGGVIRANLQARVALRVTSSIEARVIEMPGADSLLGNGDLLYGMLGDAVRLQGAFLATAGSDTIVSEASAETA